MSDVGREQTRMTVQTVYDRIAQYVKSDSERVLVDLGIRTAFGLHPDYWSDYEVRLIPTTDDASKPVQL